MNKFLAVVCVLIFSSCSKDDEVSYPKEISPYLELTGLTYASDSNHLHFDFEIWDGDGDVGVDNSNGIYINEKFDLIVDPKNRLVTHKVVFLLLLSIPFSPYPCT